MKKKENENIIATNSKAYHDYFIEQTYEAGICLVGSEVKSLRKGQANLKDSYVIIKNNELVLMNCHITPYEKGSYFNTEAKRTRKLLMHKKEIMKLKGLLEKKGYTLVVTKLYFVNALVKCEVAVAKGKHLYDKRKDLKEKQMKRDIERELSKNKY